MQIVRIAPLAASLFALAACAVETEDGAVGSTTTVVEIAPDGSEKVSFYVDDPAAQREDGLGTSTQAFTKDLACSSATVRLHDDVNLLGNRICFLGTTGVRETLDLSRYCRKGITWCSVQNGCRITKCLATWSKGVKSLWSGAHSVGMNPANGADCLTSGPQVTTGAGGWCLQQAERANIKRLW